MALINAQLPVTKKAAYPNATDDIPTERTKNIRFKWPFNNRVSAGSRRRGNADTWVARERKIALNKLRSAFIKPEIPRFYLSGRN